MEANVPVILTPTLLPMVTLKAQLRPSKRAAEPTTLDVPLQAKHL